jgi:hypothetical protein
MSGCVSQSEKLKGRFLDSKSDRDKSRLNQQREVASRKR